MKLPKTLKIVKKNVATPEQEAAALDAKLELIHKSRAELIAMATKVAQRLCVKNGEVTSTEVWNVLKKKNIDVSAHDPRWMGAVFHASKWRRTRYEATGSHKRPVSVWTFAS